MSAGEMVELVVGADGLIGGSLFHAIKAEGRSVVGTTRRTDSPQFHHHDLASPTSVWSGPPVSVAYLCAAMTNLAACERDPVGAARINVDGTLRLAEQLLNQGAFVVFFSTNHVFDGSRPLRKSDEKTCPFNEYGRQKAFVEERLGHSKNVAVLRLTKVIGTSVPLFDRWIDAVKRGEPIQPYVELSLAPVKLERVVEVACGVGSFRQTGLYHLSGDVDLSYFEAAKIGISALGLDLDLVVSRELGESDSLRLSLPRYTTLEMSQFGDLSINPLETSEQTIWDYFMSKAA